MQSTLSIQEKAWSGERRGKMREGKSWGTQVIRSWGGG